MEKWEAAWRRLLGVMRSSGGRRKEIFQNKGTYQSDSDDCAPLRSEDREVT